MSDTTERLHPIRIFCDFDGTISTTDIGYDFFDTFGCQDPLHDDLVSGRISIYDYWRGIVRTLREPMTADRLDDYLRSIPIDPATSELLELVRSEEVPFVILSDGLSLYVHRFLELNGITGVPVICNDAVLTQDGSIDVSFPHAADGCECPSAVCKRNVVLTSSTPDERIIYIGDGLSDFCPVACADVIFAKGSLAAHCNANGLPHHSWKGLNEVVPELRKLLSRRRVRVRHQAQLARKRVWESG